MNRGLALAVLALGLLLALLLVRCAPTPRPPVEAPAPPLPESPLPPAPADAPPVPAAPPPRPLAADCSGPERFRAAAAANRASLDTIAWAPFGRAERGWRTYAPFIAEAATTGCPPDSPGFAEALASAAPGGGVVGPAAFAALKNREHGKRPFVALRGRGVCPDSPPEDRLVTAGPTEGYRGKAVLMRPAVLAAYRRMVADARRELPELSRDADMLDIFSAYRSPTYDAARCARDGNCQGITRAACSPHRTGLALDLVVGSAPGYGVDSSADPNRLAQSQTPAYRWLVRNARRYGFVNYVFEPWHWEYVEEPV